MFEMLDSAVSTNRTWHNVNMLMSVDKVGQLSSVESFKRIYLSLYLGSDLAKHATIADLVEIHSNF